MRWAFYIRLVTTSQRHYKFIKLHRDSMKSKPNFVFHISTSNTKTVFNIFGKKLSVVWFDCLIKEDVQNVLLLLARKPGGAGAIGQQHRRQGQRFLQCALTYVCHYQ